MSLTPMLDLPILFHHYGGKGETLSSAKGKLSSLLGKALPAGQSLMGNILVEASQVPVTLDMNDLLPSSGPTRAFCKGGAHMHTYT